MKGYHQNLKIQSPSYIQSNCNALLILHRLSKNSQSKLLHACSQLFWPKKEKKLQAVPVMFHCSGTVNDAPTVTVTLSCLLTALMVKFSSMHPESIKSQQLNSPTHPSLAAASFHSLFSSCGHYPGHLCLLWMYRSDRSDNGWGLRNWGHRNLI